MEEMKTSTLEKGMSRRSLLKWAGLATVGSAALGATGCVGFNEKTPTSDTGDMWTRILVSGFHAAAGLIAAARGSIRRWLKMARWYASAPISRTRILPTVRSCVAVLADVHFVA